MIEAGTIAQTTIEIPDFCDKDKACVHYSFNEYEPAIQIELDGCGSGHSVLTYLISGLKNVGKAAWEPKKVDFVRGEISYPGHELISRELCWRCTSLGQVG